MSETTSPGFWADFENPGRRLMKVKCVDISFLRPMNTRRFGGLSFPDHGEYYKLVGDLDSYVHGWRNCLNRESFAAEEF